MGASVVKVEPPGGDPLARMCPGYYEDLSVGQEVVRLDLKDRQDLASLETRLRGTDLLLTASRPAALGRLGLSWPSSRQVSALVPGRHSRASPMMRIGPATNLPTRRASGVSPHADATRPVADWLGPSGRERRPLATVAGARAGAGYETGGTSEAAHTLASAARGAHGAGGVPVAAIPDTGCTGGEAHVAWPPRAAFWERL